MSGIDAPDMVEPELPADDLPWEEPPPPEPAAEVAIRTPTSGTTEPIDFASGKLSLEQLGKIGRVLYASGFFTDARSEAQAITKIIAGYEIGITPFRAMTGFHVIQGKPTMGAGLVGAQVKKSGRYDFRPLVTEPDRCVIQWYQMFNGTWEEVGTSEVTYSDARRAGLVNKDNWKKYPVDMLFARALTAGARRYCPDVFGGAVYTPEEMDSRIVHVDEGIAFGEEGGAG